MKARKICIIALTVFTLLVSTLACNLGADNTTNTDSPVAESVTTQEIIDIVVETEQPKLVTLRQWAASASASSEYYNPEWSALQVVGQPDTSECDDLGTAWASAESTGVEWLEVLYETPVYPEQINVFETYSPNQVVKVEVLDTEGIFHPVYSGPPAITDCPYTLTVDIVAADYLAEGVRLTIDQSILHPNSWNEIDAVELVGKFSGEITAEVPSVPTPFGSSSTTSNYELPGMSPSSLSPGTFYYDVAGAGEDTTIDVGTLQDLSTTDEYVLGFVSQSFRYAVSLFLPHGLTPGLLTVQKYDGSAFMKNPGAAIYIGSGYYYADGGLIMIESAQNNLASGSFVFSGTYEYDPSRIVTVSGVFNEIPLVDK